MSQPPLEDRVSPSENSTEVGSIQHDSSGLSLDKLNRAFAELLGKGEDPYFDEDVDSLRDADDSCEVTPRSILEAMLFVGSADEELLTSRKVASLMRGVSPREIDELVRELNAQYLVEECPYRIVSVGSGYKMSLREDFDRLRDRFYGRIRQARLSKAAIEVLAIVAYHQPTTKQLVDKLRGKPSGPLLSQLVRRRLLSLARPKEKPRAVLYSTTERFLQLFHLESIEELPKTPEFDHLS